MIYNKDLYRKASNYFFNKYVSLENLKLKIFIKWEIDLCEKNNIDAVNYIIDLFLFKTECQND